MTDDINLDEFEPPDRPDFRRVGRGIPYPIGLDGKRVRYSRSSNAGKILDDESNLTDWKLRTVVAGAAQRPELMAAASVLDIDNDKKQLRDIAEECLVAGRGQRRAIIGTAVHAMFDHLDRGDLWRPPPQFEDLCTAYIGTLEDWGLVPEEIEIHCINDEYRLAGTLDRRYRTVKSLVAPDGTVIPIGSMIVGDIKTGKELEYAAGSYATQLTAYVDSERYDVGTDTRFPFVPESVRDWALVIHAESSGERVDVYWVDLNAGRIGLRLANEVREWRRRDDLLTIAHRLRIVIPDPTNYADQQIEADEALGVVPPSPATDEDFAALPVLHLPDVPPLPPVVPVATSGAPERSEYLRGRVRALMAHSAVATQALARAWPIGVPGLKHEGHSWEQLDEIQTAVELIETNYSVPFYPEFVDPALEKAKREHPSNVWAKPKESEPSTVEHKQTVQDEIMRHPRSGLMRRWIGYAINGGIDHDIDTTALAHALFEFGSLDEGEWNDDDLTVMLDGSLRALGYVNGCDDLGHFNPEHAPLLMSAAFAITAGNAYLLFGEDGKPVVRTNVRKS